MRKIVIILCMFSLVLSSCAFIRRGEQADPKLVQELMVRSGLDKQLEQYPRMIQSGLEQYRKNAELQNYTDEEFAELLRHVQIAYGPEKLKDSVQRGVSGGMSDADLRPVLAWLGSPTGEKITRLEENASTPEAFAESQTIADALRNDPARVDLIQKLDRAMKGTESAIRSTQYTNTALLTAVYAEYPPGSRPSAEEIDELARSSTEMFRRQLKQVALRYFLYTYRSLSDVEIDQYMAFCGSDAGKKYIEVGHAALNNAMLQAGRELGTEVGKMLMQREQSGAECQESDTGKGTMVK